MLFALPAQAVEWTDHAPSAQRPGDASGLSALPLGNGGFLLRGPGATQWYDADGQFVRSGQPLLLTGAPLGTAPDGVALRAIQPLFEVPPLAPDCSFARLDGAHDVRELSHRFRSAEPNPADPAAAHYAWRSGEAPALVRVDADCQSAVVPVPLLHGLSVANAQDAPGAYVLGTAEIGSAREAQPADVALPVEHRLLRIAPGGEVLWTVVLPGPVTHMALAPQGDGVVLAGASEGDAASHHVARVDADGNLLWSTDLDLEDAAVVALDGAADDAAVLWLQHESDFATSAVHVAADETATVHALGERRLLQRVPGHAVPPAWEIGRTDDVHAVDRQVVRIAADGSLELLYEPADGSEEAQERVAFQLADGHLLLAAPGVRADQAFTLFDPGTGASTPLQLPADPSRSETTALVEADGLTASVASDVQGSNRLRLLDADGSLLWDRELTPEWTGGASNILPWRLAFSGNDVCATHSRPETGPRNPGFISCVEIATGEISVPLLEVEPAVAWAPVVFGDGPGRTLLYARPDCTPAGHCLVSRALDGTGLDTPVVLVEGGFAEQAGVPVAVGDDGVVVAFESGPGGAVYRVDAGAELAWSHEIPAPRRLEGVAAAPDGRVLLVLRGDGITELAQLDADGNEDWTTTVDGFRAFPAATPDGWLAAVHDGERSVVQAFAAADGTLEWTTQLGAQDPFAAQVAGIARTDADVAVLRRTGSLQTGASLRLDWLAHDGTLLGADYLPAPGSAFELPLLLAAGDAVFAGGSDVGTAWSARREAPLPPDPITASLLGSWYTPQTSGQGLFLGTAGGSGVYGGWFTFALDGGNDRDDLRWYTLQGGIAEDGSASLSIFETVGGAFATAAAEASTEVGTAVLRRQGCDHAELAYAFFDGGSGGIPLQRVAAADCSDETAAATLPTGAFYNPATSGQGLFFEPIAVGGTDLLTGLWFTFDPAGAADDPAAQHWFTLGAAAPGNDGRTVFEVFRTIGGSFDGRATNNTHRVGSATLEAESCGPATLAWQFDDSTLAGSFAGLSGEQALQPVVACP